MNNRKSKQGQPTSTFKLHNPVLPPLPEKVRRLVNAAYEAHGGAEHMNLDEWREVEQELQQRLKTIM